jgi:AbrB family looped-hinge helix DNA binding protein
VSIDSAGRVVVPKRLRDALGLSPDTPLEIDVVGDHLELSASDERTYRALGVPYRLPR